MGWDCWSWEVKAESKKDPGLNSLAFGFKLIFFLVEEERFW
jgi:hypothetical protein